jgi:hypothetical protein
LIAFATRLCKEVEDRENWPLDGVKGATKFNDLSAEWRADIDATTATELRKLVLFWANDASREQFALRALDVLKGQAKESWDVIISELSRLELSARPEGVSSYLGGNFSTIEMARKNQLIEKMDVFINTNNPDKQSSEGYDTLARSMSDAAWSAAPLRDHLVRLLDRINAMHNNPDYLRQLLPIAAGLFKFTANQKVGQTLTLLLANAAGTPAAYIVVHHSLKGLWPDPSENIGNYNPEDIVTRACQFIREQPGNAGIGMNRCVALCREVCPAQ